jgi:hypothetical protein
MGGIKQLDAFVLNRGSLIAREPYTFAFGGIDYRGDVWRSGHDAIVG